MKLTVVSIAIGFAVLAGLSFVQLQQINANKNNASQIASLKAQLSNKRTLESSEATRQCAIQSEKVYASMKADWSHEGLGIKLISFDYQDHYNAKLGKCFMTTDQMSQSNIPPYKAMTTKLLFDAYENRTYGHYVWVPSETKKYWEQPPMMCSITLLTGVEKTCNSTEEYDALVAQYME